MSGAPRLPDTSRLPGTSNASQALGEAHVAGPTRGTQASAPETTKSSQTRRSVIGYRPPQAEADKYRLSALLWLAGISLLLVPMATLLDVPIAHWFNSKPLPSEAGKILNLSLVYAHGGGIFLILLAILMMAPTKRWKLPRLATLALGAGAVATIVKMFVLRPRPNSLKLDLANYDHAWIWSFDWTLSRVADFDASTRAFPSAYLATATALTVGLWIVVPRGRPLFLAFCVGTMLQRLYCGAHFMSDLFGSAAAGLSWCYICYHPSLMGTLFDKMELVQARNPRSSPEIKLAASSSLPERTPASEAVSPNPASVPPPPHFTKPPLPSKHLTEQATTQSQPVTKEIADQQQGVDGQPDPNAHAIPRFDPPSHVESQDKPSSDRQPKVA
ncbi:MAG: phosphatase PAP2 family protein [Rubripirellula sp.]|nr:phosphatase PAP2 family protein [Rubripirellula sp.]